MTSPFDFVSSVSDNKKDLIKSGTHSESEYIPYIVNKSLSYHLDSLFYANDMNIFANIPKVQQYQYLLSTLKPRKRFGKWQKPVEDQLVIAIESIFDISLQTARDLAQVLNTKEQEQVLELYHERTTPK